MDMPEPESSSPRASQLDMSMQVGQRLAELRGWLADWHTEDCYLRQRIESLNPNCRADVMLGSQIASVRRHLACRVARRPIYLDPDTVRHVGFTNLRHHLATQYANLGLADRQLWLTNLSFLLTPTLQTLIGKLNTIRRYRSLGQARCFLLGGVSGTGKSSLLNWYAANYIPRVEAARNHVPVVKIDAPVSNRSPKPLFQRILRIFSIIRGKPASETEEVPCLAFSP